MKHALLLHLLDWNYEKAEFVIDEDISFINLEEHPIHDLYIRLCTESGVDDGDPLIFESALLLNDNEKKDYSILPSSSPWSVSSTVLSILTMIHGGTVGHCRVITSKDNFETSWATYELYDPLSEGAYELQTDHKKLDSQNLYQIRQILANLKTAATLNLKNPRINNALNYFFLAWNVHTFEQTAIGISIVIETLFSPNSNSELSHQVSFNLSKFAETTKKGRQETYKMIKKYYSIRSKIVHGEPISNDEHDSIPLLFKFISSVLLQILVDKKWIELFNDNKLRKQYLNDLLFD